MPVSRRELKEYLEPALSRRTFKFTRLRGLVHEETLQSLRFAKAFSRPERPQPAAAHAGPDKAQIVQSCPGSGGSDLNEAYNRKRNGGRELIRELSKTGPSLRLPVMDVLQALSGCARSGEGIQMDLRERAIREIQKILRECGVHAVFGRPSSAGLMLRDCEAAGIPLRIYLGESSGNNLGRRRLNLDYEGAWSFELDLTQIAARLIQAMDYWLSEPDWPPARLDSFRLSLIHSSREMLINRIKTGIRSASLTAEELPVLFALDVSCLRLLNDNLELMAAESSTPRQFFAKALNMSAGGVVAHEISHLQESRANGAAALNPQVKEAFAYLMQGVYSDPADAFRSMMLHGFDITLMMPNFDAALRSMGPHSFCLERSYLRGWARGMLSALERQFGVGSNGRPEIDAMPVIRALAADYVREGDMPYLERAMCNPNLRIDPALLRLPHPESP